MPPLLTIKNLQVTFSNKGIKHTVVNGLNFSIEKGKLTAIVGESGSGKSITALSLLQLLPPRASAKGEIIFCPNETGINLMDLETTKMNTIRGNGISMIFQEPMTSLNPVLTCGNQVMEVLIKHKRISKKEARQKTVDLFKKTGLPNPEQILKRYPHQLSGGQKQRIMIAMAISCNPALLIADEPTTALDVTVQKNILALLKELQMQNSMAVILITHDLGLISDVADDIIVMQNGTIAEYGNAQKILYHPQHDYTKLLLASRPAIQKRSSSLLQPSLPENTASLPGEKRPAYALEVKNLWVKYAEKKTLWGKIRVSKTVVQDVSFYVNQNETLGLVGESGCGKTTLGRAILGLIKPSAGDILLKGKNLAEIPGHSKKLISKNLQVVFQDPYGSLNPKLTIAEALTEPMKVHGLESNKKQRVDKAVMLLEKVNLKADYLNRYPHQFSGGQRQRICIARALSVDPSFIIFDESVSALDVSIQLHMLQLIDELKNSQQFTSIFISHDLSVVHYISNRIMVMHQGKIVETGTADEIIYNPKMAYTQQLIDAIPGKNLR